MASAFRLPFILLLAAIIFRHHTTALPLSVNSRWIVDDRNSGERVKLSCINWVSHLDAAVAEGLSKQPVDAISKKILAMGFNCVRLTYPLFLFTNDTLASTTVRKSLQNLGLSASAAGVQVNNPSIVDLSLIDAFVKVVSNLDRNNIMIILDNHISKPGWCCNDNDGNGFFGDIYFDPEVWVKGIERVAAVFKGYTNVVGMSLRNELRGYRQNIETWYKYMQKGAEGVHSANPDVLVILSGLSYDQDLSFIHDRLVTLSFSKKLVFEVHWYGFSDGDDWITGNTNQVCGRIIDMMTNKSGFLLELGYPLFVSEWGVDQRGTNENDNRYLNCFLGWVAEHDLDWALWTIVGSYYIREGVAGWEEFYGVLNWNWYEPRNSSFLEKISPLQSPFQAPEGLLGVGQNRIIFHPSTGLCLQSQSLTLGLCNKAEAWDFTPQNILTVKGTNYCLQADGLHMRVKLSIMCTDASSKWEAISASKMHLSSKLNDSVVCLDIDSENTIVTNPCKCLSKDKLCDPASQWFIVINSTTVGVAKPIVLSDSLIQSSK